MAGLQSALAYRLALVDQERQQQQQGYDFLRRSLLHKVVAACAQGGSAAKLDHHGGRVSSSDELVIRDERGIASTGDSDVVSNAGDDMTGVSVSSQRPSPDEETEEPPSRKLLGFQRTPMESVSAKGKKREEGTFGAGMLETTGGRLQGLDDSDVVPSFRPTISLVSARLARQRRLKDRAEGLPISEYLFQRGKATNRVSKQEQGETVRAHADPTVATRVRKVTFTASTMERLYSNPKGKQGNDTQHRKQQLQDISPTDIDLPFHPLISERAAKLQRGTSRKVHDDLYEHGVRRQLQKNCAQPRNEPSFHPTINQVSEMIVRGLSNPGVAGLT
ncbi:T. brucei spp.-specific protein [Trypanosoma brucei gambiense DAL972]|uniref:T. brucei spp.-specific protein n=1 Tax=Trypanosoma brucei gambiense (strain MHOM/CI/86/DAL972) TaxID=679716 RepID=D0A6W8_TRYB9|nr:T. brucei spp.-specific protein [Trypanosoma brucei gambiense DAL972]CBH17419.1 T. brucei spp.-specific protein [Trypanosoma brucei gambiense DAL972]|eukprot:XP_011779683.1 T. brucei spp.-specific protein [Trypanosoma brucei gambiense DAL972]